MTATMTATTDQPQDLMDQTRPVSKWKLDSQNPPGPIQVGRFQDAVSKVKQEHNTHEERWGVIGKEEHSATLFSPFGVASRPEVAAALVKVGEAHNWTLSRLNIGAVTAELLKELPVLKENRPVDDKRRTPEAAAQERAETQERERLQQEKTDARDAEAREIAKSLRERYPWAIPDAGGRPAPRAAANCKKELGQVFPDHSFNVKSDHNSFRVSWTLGPTEAEVKKITGKYQSGTRDGMTDSTNHDHSAHGEAVDMVLGRVTYQSLSRDCDNTAVTLMLTPILCELEGVPYNPATEPWQTIVGTDHRDCPENAASAIRQILYNQSFPPFAEITGIEVNPEDGTGATGPGWDRYYRATYRITRDFVAPAQADAPGPDQGAASVAYNAEHNGIEVRFPAKPDGAVITALKSARFRWSQRSKVWYAKASPYVLERACQIAGSTDATQAQILAKIHGATDTAGIRGMEDACGVNG